MIFLSGNSSESNETLWILSIIFKVSFLNTASIQIDFPATVEHNISVDVSINVTKIDGIKIFKKIRQLITRVEAAGGDTYKYLEP